MTQNEDQLLLDSLSAMINQRHANNNHRQRSSVPASYSRGASNSNSHHHSTTRTRLHDRYDDDDTVDAYDNRSNDDDSDSSSLNEEDIREVVRQVLVMVKRPPSHLKSSVDSNESGPRNGGGDDVLSHHREPSSTSTTGWGNVSHRGSPSVPPPSLSERDRRLQQQQANHNNINTKTTTSEVVAVVDDKFALHENNRQLHDVALGTTSTTSAVGAVVVPPRGEQQRKMYHSASVATFATMVGIPHYIQRQQQQQQQQKHVSSTAALARCDPNLSSQSQQAGRSSAACYYHTAATDTSHTTAATAGTTTSPTSRDQRNSSNSAIRYARTKPSSSTSKTTTPQKQQCRHHHQDAPLHNSTTTTPSRRPVLNLKSPHNGNSSIQQHQIHHYQQQLQTIGGSALSPRGSRFQPSSASCDDASGAHDVAWDAVSSCRTTSQEVAEQKRVERLLRQRAEVMKDETFTPRTSRDADHVPDRIREVPIRGPGHWEDRLYTEYLSRKKQRELENEALRIAQQTQREIAESLDECLFAPDLDGIHDTLKEHKRNTSAYRANTSRSCSAISHKERVDMTTQRLYGSATMKPTTRDLMYAHETAERMLELRRQKQLLHAHPNETQERLHADATRREQARDQAREDAFREQQARAFQFRIKGNVYQTLPLPKHADDGSFERLHQDGVERHQKRLEALHAAQARRPSPTPQITEYAQRRATSAQPVFERLSRRKPTPSSQQVNNRSTSPSAVVADRRATQMVRSFNLQDAADMNTSTLSLTALSATQDPQTRPNTTATAATAPSPLMSDAFHALSLQPGGRSEFIIQWMGRPYASVSRQSSLNGSRPVSPSRGGGGSATMSPTTIQPPALMPKIMSTTTTTTPAMQQVKMNGGDQSGNQSSQQKETIAMSSTRPINQPTTGGPPRHLSPDQLALPLGRSTSHDVLIAESAAASSDLTSEEHDDEVDETPNRTMMSDGTRRGHREDSASPTLHPTVSAVLGSTRRPLTDRSDIEISSASSIDASDDKEEEEGQRCCCAAAMEAPTGEVRGRPDDEEDDLALVLLR